MHGQYSLRSPAVKRLMKEAQELREPTEQYHAQPLEDNLFEWHFTIRGPDDSDFNGGVYHGRIILPPEYPMKPPSIVVLTPNGRFEIFTKICLSISGHHPESWQPSWSIRTALLAIIGFMPTHGGGAIGSLNYTSEERKRLAKKTLEFKCPTCGLIKDILPPITEASKADSQEAKELASQINFQGEKKKDEDKASSTSASSSPRSVSSSTESGGSSPTTPRSPTNTAGPPWPQLPPGMPQLPPGMPQLPLGMPQLPPGMPPYNPFMPYMQQGSAGARQMRPPMSFAQFSAMQSMMQQHMQQMRGMAPRAPGFHMTWGPPGAMPGAVPRAAATQAPTARTVSQPTTVNNVSSESTGSTPIVTPSSPSNPTPVSSPVSSTAPTTPPVSSVSEQPISPQSQSASQSPGGSTSTPEGIRQRAAPAGVSTPASTRATTQATNSEFRARAAAAGSPSIMTRVVMAILALAILVLVLRRLSIMGIIKFDQEDL